MRHRVGLPEAAKWAALTRVKSSFSWMLQLLSYCCMLHSFIGWCLFPWRELLSWLLCWQRCRAERTGKELLQRIRLSKSLHCGSKFLIKSTDHRIHLQDGMRWVVGDTEWLTSPVISHIMKNASCSLNEGRFLKSHPLSLPFMLTHAM